MFDDEERDRRVLGLIWKIVLNIFDAVLHIG